jgi:hypothetical protein
MKTGPKKFTLSAGTLQEGPIRISELNLLYWILV